jgi:hypothetical protein
MWRPGPSITSYLWRLTAWDGFRNKRNECFEQPSGIAVVRCWKVLPRVDHVQEQLPLVGELRDRSADPAGVDQITKIEVQSAYRLCYGK